MLQLLTVALLGLLLFLVRVAPGAENVTHEPIYLALQESPLNNFLNQDIFCRRASALFWLPLRSWLCQLNAPMAAPGMALVGQKMLATALTIGWAVIAPNAFAHLAYHLLTHPWVI